MFINYLVSSDLAPNDKANFSLAQAEVTEWTEEEFRKLNTYFVEYFLTNN